VLSKFETLKLCVAYEVDGRRLEGFPASLSQLEQVRPIYQELEGWQRDISGVTAWQELPQQARDYVTAVERAGGARVGVISVGPDRVQTIHRKPDE
jgi:adenylosuccinate synthase